MLLAVTLGDASGVGPEIALKAYAEDRMARPFVVIGDMAVLTACNEWLGYGVELTNVDDLNAAVPDAFNVLDMGLMTRDDIVKGKASEKSGAAALKYLERAIREALAGTVSALVTLPMNKTATRMSTPDFSGHTEVIAGACNCTEYAMTLVSDRLIVPHVSAHVSLKQAVESLTADRILTVIRLAHQTALKLGRGSRIAVMGLNPHAGEGGAFGDEEAGHIEPAVKQARNEGIDATGPLPPDTVFMRALRGDFQVVVCMYHDQGHVPMKTIGMDDAVNVTLGLPIVRTSVSHGTAFDIAYKGVASPGSFVNACELAAMLASGQK